MSSIQALSNKLAVLGYTGYEIAELIRSVTHGRKLQTLSAAKLRRVADVLEQHVRLGTEFVATYSK